MFGKVLFEKRKRWFVLGQGLTVGVITQSLIFLCYFEYMEIAHDADWGLIKRGSAYTRSLISAIDANYEQGRLTVDSLQALLKNTVCDKSEPYAASVKTFDGAPIASAGSEELLRKGATPAKKPHDDEIFVATDTFRLHRQGVEHAAALPGELAQGTYVLSVAISARDEADSRSVAQGSFWVHASFLLTLGILMYVVTGYQERLRSSSKLRLKTLTHPAE
jgi:hypothetical protein